MKEKISRLARGIIDASVPEIRISREKIEDVIPCDGIYRGDFRIVSGNQLAFSWINLFHEPRRYVWVRIILLVWMRSLHMKWRQTG